METIKNIEIILQTATLYWGFLFFIVGLSIASFFNVVILRLPQMYEKENIEQIKEWFDDNNLTFPKELDNNIKEFNLSFPSSHCYTCHTSLKWYDNIPLFSYLFLRGRCRYCSTPYSIQYPIIELLGGVILLATYLFFIPQGLFVFILASIFFLLTFLLASIDLKTLLLPDSIVYSLLWIGLLFSASGIHLYPINLTESVYGAIVGYCSLWIISRLAFLIKGQDAMGEGDLKLLSALGIFVGIKGAIFTLFFSPFIGIITWVIFKLMKKKQIQIPYGPSLIIASIFYLFYGNQFLSYILY